MKKSKRTPRSKAAKRQRRMIVLTAFLVLFAMALLFYAEPWAVLYQPPSYENAALTIYDFEAMIGAGQTLGGTTNYQTVMVPDREGLYLNGLPKGNTLPIYQVSTAEKALDQGEFQAFCDRITANMMSALGKDVGTLALTERHDRDSFMSSGSVDNYTLHLYQSGLTNSFSLYSNEERHQGDPVLIGGHTLTVDQTESDDRILQSLEPIRDVLFSVIGTSFTDARVRRIYGPDMMYGVGYLRVYYFNEADHPLNSDIGEIPQSDYLEIDFDNNENYGGQEILSATDLYDATVRYQQCRVPAAEQLAKGDELPIIPLREAERLLRAGYVFCGHACRACQASQIPVSFAMYDYVDLEYQYFTKASGERIAVPFYAFYERYFEWGYLKFYYAVTYVPAIEVADLPEYMAFQESTHR